MQDAALGAQEYFEDSFEDQQLSLDMLSAKLKSFAKEHFPEFTSNPVTHLDIIRDSAALRSFNLPTEFTEFFVTFETAKYLLISDAPLIHKCEENITNSKKSKGAQYENLFEIKKFYLKWCIEKQDRETEYFALSTLNLIERNANKENFLKYLYAANLYIFGPKRRSLAKSLEYLESAEKALSASTLQDDYKSDVMYYIQLFRSFAFIADTDAENAAIAINEAISIKPSGITGLLYSILYPLMTEESQNVSSRLHAIVDFDISRFTFAIDHNNLNLFSFFLRTAITYNIFRVQEFAPFLGEIKTILETSADAYFGTTSKIFQTASDLKGSVYKEYFTDKIKNDLDFSLLFLERYKTAKNLFIALSFPRINQKFDENLGIIKQRLKSSIFSKTMGELEFYDQQSRDYHEKLKRLNDELEQNKLVIKKNQQQSHDETEKKYNGAINAVESKIGAIDLSPDFDPASVFNNIMVYNVIISIMIFIIGGFVGSFAQHTTMQISDLFGSLFIYGVKWGGFVFLGGLFIALISSASKALERTNEKHRLQKKLTGYKNQKDRALERIKKDFERKLGALDEINQTRVKEIQKKTETLRVDKEEKEKELKELVAKETAEHFKKIDELINKG